jgi:ATP-dependent Clp protease ATP-binding subunit ClpA
VMDHGKLTDHNGKHVDFQNVILIMTTNAGAADMAKAAIGFNRTKREGDDEEAINRMFSPEFRNRLDAIIPFGALPPSVISQVVEKFVFQLEAQLGDRNITIELTPEANAWLADRGYDDKFGARPLARVIQEHIKKPLAEEILFGALKDGGTVRVVVKEKDGERGLDFDYISADAPIKPRDTDEEEVEAKVKAKAKSKVSKPKAKRTRKPPGDSKESGSGSVPKVPLGED